MLGAVGEESGLTLKRLVTDSEPDARCFLHIPHPLPIDICGADVHLVAVYRKPDRDIVGRARLAAIVRQPHGLPAR